MILICTWNEWHEGTEIEPSREYGFDYLKITEEYAARYKGVEPPTPPPPSIAVSLSGNESGVELVLENGGAGPAVITSIELVNASPGFPLEPEDCRAYRLPINSSAYAVFLPYLAPGEKVRIRCVPTGAAVAAKATAWSATGEVSSASLKAGGVAGKRAARPRPLEEGGPPLALIAGGAAAAILGAAVVAWIAARRRGRSGGGPPT